MIFVVILTSLIFNGVGVVVGQNSGVEIIRGEYSRKHSQKDLKESGVVSVVFNEGKKKIDLNPGDRIEHGIRFRRFTTVVASDNHANVIVHTKDVNLDERNPYRIKAAPSRITWYRADGTISCEVNAPMAPIAIAPKGSVVLAVEDGFDEVEFEKYNDVPGLESTEKLKNDTSLTENRLYLLDSSCSVVFQATSRSGWDTLLISPSGKWITFKDHATPNALAVVEVATKQKFTIDISGGRDWSIGDMGTLTGYKYIGQGNTVKQTVRSRQNREIKIKTRLFQKLIWEPGYPGVKALEEMIEK